MRGCVKSFSAHRMASDYPFYPSRECSQVIYELREYRLQPQFSRDYVENFEAMLLPLLRKNEFRIVGTWLSYLGEGHVFIWLIEWADFSSREAAFDRVYQEAGWSSYQAANAPFVVSTKHRILKPTRLSELQ